MKRPVRIIISLILALALCTLTGFLMSLTARQDALMACSDVEVEFADSLGFVTSQDIRKFLDENYGTVIGVRLDSLHLAVMENMLESKGAVLESEAWTSLDGKLHIRISQRAPVMRLSYDQGGYYIDASGYIFPLHKTYTAPVPLTCGNIPVRPPKGYKGQAPDSLSRVWIGGLLDLNRSIEASRSLRGRVDSIVIRPSGDACLKIKDAPQDFVLGDFSGIDGKLGRIDKYFSTIEASRASQEGAQAYKEVIVKYKNQIICK